MSDTDAVGRLLARLEECGLGFSPRQVAEALWLSTHLHPQGPMPLRCLIDRSPSLESPVGGATHSPSELIPPAARLAHPPGKAPPVNDGRTSLHVGADRVARDGVAAIPFDTPTPAVLPQRRGLLRSLHPLAHRIPSHRELALDEDATADLSAEARAWMPVMRRVPSRWLELVLIPDRSSSMILWQDAARELRQILEYLGAFRRISTWRVVPDARNGTLGLQLDSRMAGAHTAPRDARSLVDLSGRTLVLFVSDCVSPAWHRGDMDQLLTLFGRAGPTAIIQMLPQQLWPRTGLVRGIPVPLGAQTPRDPNTRLRIRASIGGETDRRSALPVPVVTLDPGRILAWARMVSGAGGACAPGILLVSSAAPEASGQPQGGGTAAPDEATAEKRVLQFRACTSAMAQRLAAFLAAVPLTLPVMHLVQHVALPKSGPEHFAEVFLSGLIRGVTPGAEARPPDEVEYDFVEGVREVLLSSLRRTDLVEVLEQVAVFVDRQRGRRVRFTALLADPTRADTIQIDRQSRPFAVLSASVLQPLGGRFQVLAERLRRAVDQTPDLGQRSPSAIQSRDRIGDSGRKHGMAPPPPAPKDIQSFVRMSESALDALSIEEKEAWVAWLEGTLYPPAPEVLDATTRMRTLMGLSRLYFRLKHLDQAMSAESAALEVALGHVDGGVPDPSAAARLYAALGWIEYVRGDSDLAERLSQRSLEIAARHGDTRQEVQALRHLGAIQGERSPEDGLAAFHAALAKASDVGDPSLQARVFNGMGALLTRIGRLADAETYLRLALEYAARSDDPEDEMHACYNLGLVLQYRKAEDCACLIKAEELFRQSAALADTVVDLDLGMRIRNSLGTVQMELGRWDDAEKTLLDALDRTREYSDRSEELQTVKNLLRLYRWQRRWDDVAKYERNAAV